MEQLLRDPGDGSLEQLTALPQDTAVANFRQQLDDLLSIYGERHGHGYGSRSTVHIPTWREQPAQLLRLAAPYLDPDVEPPAVSRVRAQSARDEHVEAMLASCADEEVVAEFRRLLANGRYWWTVLEIHNHYIDQMAGGQVRHAIMAAANWLVKGQILPDEDGVFWLTFAEIMEALRATESPDLAPLLRLRKA